MSDIKTETEPKTGFMDKMKERWGVNSYWDVIAILLVFTFTGSSVVYLRKHLYLLLGYDQDTAAWIKFVTYILCVFPMYQGLILVYGFLLGQFSFFWEKEKKLGRAIMRLFGKGKKA